MVNARRGDITQPVWWICETVLKLKDTADSRVWQRRRMQGEPERNRSAEVVVQGERSCSRELSRVGQECCSLLFSCPPSCTETLAIIDSALDPLRYLLFPPELLLLVARFPPSPFLSFSLYLSLPFSFSLARLLWWHSTFLWHWPTLCSPLFLPHRH